MEVFTHLPTEKKERIINAAMYTFAAYGYHKASVADIAKAAGISKSMIFTYFGSKHDCYRFMCDEMLRVIVEEFNEHKEELYAVSDYFDRIILAATVKTNLMKRYPSLLSFATYIFDERDAEVTPIINRIFQEGYKYRDMFLEEKIEESKFKDPLDAPRLNKITTWLAQGFAKEWSQNNLQDLDKGLLDIIDCLLTLKKYFYKEEYL